MGATLTHLQGVICLVAFGSLANSAEPDTVLAVSEIVQTHTNTLSKLRSARAQIRHDPAGRQNTVVKHHFDTWYRRGAYERFSRRTHRDLPSIGLHISRSEVFLNYDTRTMSHWMIANEALLGAYHSDCRNGVLAFTAPFDQNPLEMQIYGYFLLRFAAGADDHRTLTELVAESSVVSISEEVLDGQACRVLDITQVARDSGRPTEMRVFLDPTAGFLARKCVVKHLGDGRVSLHYVVHIKNFREFGDGIYFPTESETYTVDSDGHKAQPNRFRVESMEVNCLLSDDEVLPHFPEGTLVSLYDVPVTPLAEISRPDVALIGPNNQVVRTFSKDSNELVDFLADLKAEEIKGADSAGQHRTAHRDSKGIRLGTIVFYLAMGTTIGVVVGFGWLFVRRHANTPK